MSRIASGARFALAQFMSAESGTVAIIFAFACVPLILAIGFSIDYGLALSARSKAQNAADAAIVAGVRAAARERAAGNKDWEKRGQNEAAIFFAANTENMHFNFEADPKIEIKLESNVITGTLTQTFQRPTELMKIAGNETVTIGVRAMASKIAGNFIDIHFIIDNSASMGIGAETADQEKMLDNTRGPNPMGRPCAFACHTPTEEGFKVFLPSSARKAGATLRIDVARGAMEQAIKDLQNRNIPADQVRISIWTFSLAAKQLLKVTTDLSAALQAVSTIDLAIATTVGEQTAGTMLKPSLAAINKELPIGGTGSSTSDRKSYVVLFTDGLEDSSFRSLLSTGYYLKPAKGVDPAGWSANKNVLAKQMQDDTYMQPFSQDSCDPLKRNGHYVIPLRIKYIAPLEPSANEQKKIDWVQNIVPSDIEKAFAGCASNSSDVITASKSSEIIPAFKRIVDSIVEGKPLALAR